MEAITHADKVKMFETRARKLLKKEERKKQIISEKTLLEEKLESLEIQKKTILDNFHRRKKNVFHKHN